MIAGLRPAHIADRDVSLVRREIQHRIRAEDIELETRMCGTPVRQPRHEPSRRKRIGRGDPQPPAGRTRAHGRQRIREGLEAIAYSWKELFASSRQLEWARPAAEKGSAAVTFEQLNLMADRRWRDV